MSSGSTSGSPGWPPRVERRRGLAVIRLPGPRRWRAASTGVGGGVRAVRAVVVARSGGGDPWREAREAAEAAGLDPSEAVTLLTAVDPGERLVVKAGSRAWAAATVAPSHPVCPGSGGHEAPPEPGAAGTINVVVASRDPLGDPGLLDLLRVGAEAKAAASWDLGLWCPGRPVGTASDAVAAVAPAPGEGEPGLAWSGHATVHGGEAGRLVYEAVLEGDPRGPGERLRGLIGVGPRELVEAALTVYRERPAPHVPPGEFRGLLEGILDSWLGDPNLWLLLACAREADARARSGSLPGLPRGSYEGDPPFIVADEVAAAMISLYLQGWKGLMAAYWVDREKGRIAPWLARLPPMLDDAASALVGSLLSRALDEVAARGRGGRNSHGGGQG